MPEPSVSVRLDYDILYCKLLPRRPPDNGQGNQNALFIRQSDGQREGFPLSHGQVP